MAESKALLDAGQLGAAIEGVTRQVRAHPADASHRTFLFELLCFAGDWDRAEKQLDAIGHQHLKAPFRLSSSAVCHEIRRARYTASYGVQPASRRGHSRNVGKARLRNQEWPYIWLPFEK